jgi:hypothetical protein
VAIPLLVWRIVRFAACRFFLIDVTDPVVVTTPRRIQSVGEPNLFVVCRDCEEENDLEVATGAKAFDVRDEEKGPLSPVWFETANIQQGTRVLLKHFEHRHQEPAVVEAKRRVLATLVQDYSCNVVAVCGRGANGSSLGLRAAWSFASAKPEPSPRGTADPMETFVLIDAGRWCEAGQEGDGRWASRSKSGLSPAQRLIAQERRCDRHLRRIWQGLEDSLVERRDWSTEAELGELLDLLGERAEPYYNAIWESCRLAEKITLVNLAATGLVNEKDRRVVRRLLARGLVRREPHFAVMNETFRRYLLQHRAAIERVMPNSSESTWDSVRKPILVLVIALALLLFVTQQELFTAATGMIVAMSTGLASLSRAVGLFDGRRAAAPAAE